jgi:hypothetical protein
MCDNNDLAGFKWVHRTFVIPKDMIGRCEFKLLEHASKDGHTRLAKWFIQTFQIPIHIVAQCLDEYCSVLKQLDILTGLIPDSLKYWEYKPES